MHRIVGFKALMVDWVFWATKEEREHQGRSNNLVSRSNDSQSHSNEMDGHLNDAIDSDRILPNADLDLIVNL